LHRNLIRACADNIVNMSSFQEPSDEDREPRGGGWRRLETPVRVRGYIAQNWHEVTAVNVNDETGELRVEWPPLDGDDPSAVIAHRVLSPGHYEAPPGALLQR
jgi:hypothetical protein